MRFLQFVVCASVIACQSSPPAPSSAHHDVAIGEGFSLAVGETASIEGADLSIKFSRVVQDSRCPSDVQCVWAGNGEIELVARSGRTISTFTLNTSSGAKEFAINFYRIGLASLTPVPVSTQAIPVESYRALLVVSKPGPICAAYAAAALNVEIRDSLTGAVPALTGLSVVARAGAYADSVKLAPFPPAYYGGSVPLAYERQGTFTVTVRADGYSPWSRSGIVVTADECHVIPVSLTARLVR